MTGMTTDVHDRLLDAIRTDDSPHDVLDAALDLIGFQLSVLCPDCRKEAERAIKQALPGLFAHANDLAKEYAAGVGEPAPAHTCH
jgi:hypothetical protein